MLPVAPDSVSLKDADVLAVEMEDEIGIVEDTPAPGEAELLPALLVYHQQPQEKDLLPRRRKMPGMVMLHS